MPSHLLDSMAVREQGMKRPSLIEVYRGNDYEKTLLPRLQKQSVVWVRNIKAQ